MPTVVRLRALALVFISFAIAQQPANKKPAEPPDPCAKATTQMEITNCWEDQAQKSEAQLTALYQKIQKAIQAKMAAEDGYMKEYRGRALEKLKAAQLAWSRYRDAQCAAEDQQYERGTIAPSIHAGCMKDLADRRAEELKKTYAIYLRP